MKAKLFKGTFNFCTIDTESKKPITFDEKYPDLQDLTFEKEGNKIKCYFSGIANPTPIRAVFCVINIEDIENPAIFYGGFDELNDYEIEG